MSEFPAPSGYHHVPLTAEDFDEVADVVSWAFAEADPEIRRGGPVPFAWDRAGGVRAQDRALAGVHASHRFRMPVPGGEVAADGLTYVSVHPAHRRRGVLRSMIAQHLAAARERGELLSALFAAEAGIYGRFGYGLAAYEVRLRLPRRAALREVPEADRLSVRLEHADAERHAAAFLDLHRRAGAGRPGWVSRTSDGTLERAFWDPEARRGGAESLRVATVWGTQLRALALFRRHEAWEGGVPRGVVRVVESFAADPAAARALWATLTDMDLMATTEVPRIPVDDPLLGLLVDVRSAAPAISDNLWVRLIDVPGALAARRYAAPVDVVLEVADAGIPSNAGRWRLRGGAAGAPTVEATTDAADLRLDVRELSAAYLGGTGTAGLAGLAAAGLVTELRPGSLAPAAAAFSWPVAPLTSWIF